MVEVGKRGGGVGEMGAAKKRGGGGGAAPTMAMAEVVVGNKEPLKA